MTRSVSDKTNKEDKKTFVKTFNFHVETHKGCVEGQETLYLSSRCSCHIMKNWTWPHQLCVLIVMLLKTQIMKLKTLQDIWFQSIKDYRRSH